MMVIAFLFEAFNGLMDARCIENGNEVFFLFEIINSLWLFSAPPWFHSSVPSKTDDSFQMSFH